MATAAGTDIIDGGDGTLSRSVTTRTKGFATSKLSVTRPNDTAGYSAGDVVGASTGASGALTFAGIGPTTGGEVLITSSIFERDVSALISGETTYTLHLYNATPPSALGDNAAWDLPSGDRAAYLGRIELGTPVDVGSTLWVEQNGINKQVTVPSGGSLFGYLVTNGAYTPAQTTVHLIQLHGVGA